MSYTFGIIKPTAVHRKEVGQIITFIENSGLVVKRMKTLTLTKEQVENLYAEHANRDFFKYLCDYMMCESVVVMELYLPHEMCLECPAWEYWRGVIGSTDPSEASSGTIRNKFGLSRRENTVHGSDSGASAAREIELFFDLSQRIQDKKDNDFFEMISGDIMKSNLYKAKDTKVENAKDTKVENAKDCGDCNCNRNC